MESLPKLATQQQVVQTVFEFFSSLCKQNLQPNHEIFSTATVLASFCLENTNNGTLTVISLATGTKSLPGHEFFADQSPLHDSHAEVLAKRGFQDFLYVQLIGELSGKSLLPCDQSLFVVHSEKEKNTIKLKDCYKVHLVISLCPCGDCAVSKLNSNRSDIADTGAKPLRDFNSKSVSNELATKTGILRTKPYRSDTPVTNRSSSLSCSDKIMVWNILGIQGALLSNFISPIYIDAIHVTEDLDEQSFKRGVYLKERKIHKDVEDMVLKWGNKRIGSEYRFNEPLVYLGRELGKHVTKEIEVILFSDNKKKAGVSLLWNKSLQVNSSDKQKKKINVELISGITGYKQGANTKRGVNPSVFSQVSKYGLFQQFKKLQREIELCQDSSVTVVSGALRIKKEEMDNNVERFLKEGKKKNYKMYKWISFRYSTIKSQIKRVFDEWTVYKRKGELFECYLAIQQNFLTLMFLKTFLTENKDRSNVAYFLNI